MSNPISKLQPLLPSHFDEGDVNIYNIKDNFALEIDGVQVTSVETDDSGELTIYHSEYKGETPIKPTSTFKLFNKIEIEVD